MADREERQVARLVESADFSALKVLLERREEEAVESLARKTFRLPDEHTMLEWQKLRAYWDGARSVFETVERAQKAVQQADQRKEASE